MSARTQVCLVGAGVIAETHAAAIAASPRLALAAVVDPDEAARERFRARWRIPRAHASLEEALAAGGFAAAHVLTPPDRHAGQAAALLDAGVSTLVEKPLAASAEEADDLVARAARTGARLAVNQNYVFAPAFAALRRRLASGEIGPLRHLDCLYHGPLRQLATRRFDHWMFASPLNMLLEQAVHPLSLIRILTGDPGDVVLTAAEIEPAGDAGVLLRRFSAAIAAARVSAAFSFAVGAPYPVFRLEAHGTDGVLAADILKGVCLLSRQSRWLEPVDHLVSGLGAAGALAGGATAGFARYGLAQIRLAPRSDPFFRSMRASIEAFHAGESPTDGAFGAGLVRLCENIAARLPAASARPPRPRASLAAWDVAVIGGTGFIGAHVVSALRRAGYTVGVMARRIANPDPALCDDGVALIAGDARRRADVERALGAARYVVNLAHGGGAEPQDIGPAMRAATQTVADACIDRKVERLVHLGSIASLYLGEDAGAARDDAPPDPRAHLRSPYARAKAETDSLLLALSRNGGLPLVLLRPGLVVGAGASPFHSGLGMFNSERHCIGWNGGANPLPFVLARDVADAVVRSLTAPAALRHSYAIVGDVRPSARDYIAALAEASGRPLRYHPSSVVLLWTGEMLKWTIKRIGGRNDAPPSLRDLRSRGLAARLDNSAAKADLGWAPESDAARFFAEAFASQAADR